MQSLYGKLRKRIGWLNSEGGFDGELRYDKIAEAAAHSGADLREAFRILKELEENKAEVKDPTAYVSAALRKARGRRGVRSGAGPRVKLWGPGKTGKKPGKPQVKLGKPRAKGLAKKPVKKILAKKPVKKILKTKKR